MAEQIKEGTLHLDFITPLGNGVYRLEGYYRPRHEEAHGTILARTRHTDLTVSPVDRPDLATSMPAGDYHGFVAEIQVDESDKVQFVYKPLGGDETRVKLHTGYFTYLSPLRLAYRHDKNVLIRNMGTCLYFRRFSRYRLIWYEACFWIRLLFHWRMRNVGAALAKAIRINEKRSIKKLLFELLKPLLIIVESIAMVPRACALRAVYFYKKGRQDRPIWIISDRGMSAGDNGEALYRYILDLKEDVGADVYFVLSKKSKDYAKLRGLNEKKLINQDSFSYKVLFLLAEKIISSHADVEVTNPFLRQRYHYQDLMKHVFVFLQHGVIRHDHSSWLNRYEKNIALFVTSAEKEYKSILDHDYFYEENQVALTGLPRFDYLDNKPEGKLIIAPTYRKELAQLPTNKNGARPYDPEFKKSEYFRVYQALLGDVALAKHLRANGMTLELYLHPNLQAQADDFTETDTSKVKRYPYNYKEALSGGDILVTDYSSVSFDFAYLKKPLIYYQFDKTTFYEHSLSVRADFFTDEDDGFGPVIENHDDLIGEIIATIKNRKMKSIYKKRVENFFYKVDKNNAKRVYEAITSQDDRV